MLNADAAPLLTSVVFALTYIGLAVGKVPGLQMDRTGIALVGAVLMLATGMVSIEQAVSADSIDYQTLFLLFGMMIVIGFLRLSGFFQRLAASALRRIRTPPGLLAVVIALSGTLSAFLINDIVCLMLTPVVLHLARRSRLDPIPHLIGLATAANIGSTATITGNPQNIYIGSQSGIPYLRFTARLLPVAVLGLILNFLVVAFVYRRRLFTQAVGHDARADASADSSAANAGGPQPDDHGNTWLQCKSAAVTLAVLILFLAGLPLAFVALSAAALLLLGRTDPEKIYRQIDWRLLVMFIALFIVVHAFQVNVVSHWGVDDMAWLLRRPVDLICLLSAGLSNLVSNVPAVLLLEPLLQAVPEADRETAWLALAMSSTLAGNLTVLGSVANLIVVENAGREGVVLSFREHCKVGVPLTVLSLALGIAWLLFVNY